MNENLKQLLREECNFKPSDEVMEMFLGAMTEMRVKPASRIIDYGRVNSDVYCLKEGIVRLFHVEESKEKTFGFALPGTIFLSPLSFYLNAPAFIMAETCKVPVTLLRMDRRTFNMLVDKSGEFARWMLSLTTAQICICERKLSIINGSALERYKSVLENRPEIIEAVTNKVLASYLDITPQHLCRLKKQSLARISGGRWSGLRGSPGRTGGRCRRLGCGLCRILSGRARYRTYWRAGR